MDERLMPYVRRPKRVSASIMAALTSAVLEWFLMFLLFIDASFGYMVTKFARHCNLQSPCLLCSRLDHILGNGKTGFYWDLICEKHKLKISSLVLCHLHSNLVDVHGMCESCLFSFATINKSNTETYRLLVGKLGADALLGLDQDPLIGGHVNGSSGSKSCSCCNEKWISRGYATKLFQAQSIESKGVELDEDDLKMIRDDTYRASNGIELDSPLSSSVGRDCDDHENIKENAYQVKQSNEVDASLSLGIGHEGDDLEMTRDDTYQVEKGVELDSPLSEAIKHDGNDLKLVRDETYGGGNGIEFDAPLSVAVGHDGDDLEVITGDAYRVREGVELDSPLSATVEHQRNDLKMVKAETYPVGKGAELEAPLSVSVEHDGDDLDMVRDETCREGKGAELDSPSPAIGGHGGDDLMMVRDETYHAGKVSPSSMSNFDPLPHVEYKKVKISSDSESDAQISDDETVSSLLHEEYTKKHFVAESMIPEPQNITFADDTVLEKLIHHASVPEPSPEVKLEVGDTECSTAASAPVEHGLEELKWQQVENKTDVSALQELISFDEVPSLSRDSDGSVDVSGETLDARGEGEEKVENVKERGDSKIAIETISTSKNMKDVSSLPELISFVKVPSLSRDSAGSIDVSGETLDARGEAEEEVEDVKELGDSKIAIETISTSEEQFSKPDTSETSSQLPNSLELGDAYKLALSSRQLSGKLLEQISLKESTRPSEDFKLLLSQISANRGVEISLTDMSPRLSGNIDDASSSVGMKILQKRISLERNPSGLSLDGSVVSEIEGESVVDRLKRQVEHDKRLMSILYQELEDERNASAVAVNQAMAMITRLQEEKAALQMEALQCLRMMEDQAEYDIEALQNANNLVAEKEKEIQDLQAKLELYKKRFGLIPISEDTVEPLCEPVSGEIGAEDIDASLEESNNVRD